MSLLSRVELERRDHPPDFKNAGKASPLLFDFDEQSARAAGIEAHEGLGPSELRDPYRFRSAFASSVRPVVCEVSK
jgi:hypothetical protein